MQLHTGLLWPGKWFHFYGNLWIWDLAAKRQKAVFDWLQSSAAMDYFSPLLRNVPCRFNGLYLSHNLFIQNRAGIIANLQVRKVGISEARNHCSLKGRNVKRCDVINHFSRLGTPGVGKRSFTKQLQTAFNDFIFHRLNHINNFLTLLPVLLYLWYPLHVTDWEEWVNGSGPLCKTLIQTLCLFC